MLASFCMLAFHLIPFGSCRGLLTESKGPVTFSLSYFPRDVLCGRVQCINVKNIPKMSTGEAIVQTPVEKTWCWGTELRLGKDLGAVKDGTACGSDKVAWAPAFHPSPHFRRVAWLCKEDPQIPMPAPFPVGGT